MDFLRHAPAPRELPNQPPHPWQLLRPDGEKLEHCGSGGATGGERVDERGKSRGGVEAEEGVVVRNLSPDEKNKWLEGNSHHRSIRGWS